MTTVNGIEAGAEIVGVRTIRNCASEFWLISFFCT